MLVLGRTLQETMQARDTIIFLLQHLGFVINLKKSVLDPCQEIEFLGMIINSNNLSISLPPQKLQKIKDFCMEIYNAHKVSVLELTKLLCLLSSTVQAVLPAQLQIRYLQQIQIQALSQKYSYQQLVTLDLKAKKELMWWIQNLNLCNGRCLIQPPPQLVIQTDASKTGWGANCQGLTTRGFGQRRRHNFI